MQEKRMSVVDSALADGWQCECDLSPQDKYIIVHVRFINDKKQEDEVSFDIGKFQVVELADAFTEFCKENNYPDDTVTGVYIVAAAPTMEELKKFNM